MGEYVLEHPAPDTDLEDCDFAQFEAEHAEEESDE